MKFEVAYFRSLRFGDPTREDAEAIYKKYVAGGVPAEPEYRTFQDYIFRYLIREGGRLHLPVHIHTAVGIGDYFNISESNVMNLENILRDPRYADTVFRSDSRRLSAGARGYLAGFGQERLYGFVADGSGHVSGGLQGFPAPVARNLS